MNSTEHYFRLGEALCEQQLLYKGCGLDGIYLCNGYEIEEVDGDTFIHVKDRESLHKVIALNLVEHRKTLSPAELKFIRIAMDETQSGLGKQLGVSSQTVARWEKGQAEIPGPADRMLRVLMMVKVLTDRQLARQVRDLPHMLDELDESNVIPLQFRHDVEWREAA